MYPKTYTLYDVVVTHWIQKVDVLIHHSMDTYRIIREHVLLGAYNNLPDLPIFNILIP